MKGVELFMKDKSILGQKGVIREIRGIEIEV